MQHDFLSYLLFATTALFLVLWLRTRTSALRYSIQEESLRADVQELEEKTEENRKQKEEEIEKRIEAEKQLLLIQQKMQDTQARMQDWEKTREESMKTAKAAMFESGSEMFRKQSEETMKHFESVIKSVASLGDRLNKNETIVDTVWKSLTTPAAAGQFSELSLENTLKAYGLETGRDFFMQYHIETATGSSNLRPDALVTLPGGNLLVIDSKASKFFLELADASQDKEKEQVIIDKLKKRMHDHVKGLSGKGYKDAVSAMYRHTGRKEEIHHIVTIMYVQSDANIERLCSADPSFRDICAKEDIVLSGPGTLSGIMSFAKYAITIARQEKHHEDIIHEVSLLLGSIRIMMEHGIKTGKSLQSAADHFSKFAGSVNRNFLPKAHKVAEMGVPLPKNKELPKELPQFELRTDTPPLIEGESQDITDTAFTDIRKLSQS